MNDLSPLEQDHGEVGWSGGGFEEPAADPGEEAEQADAHQGGGDHNAGIGEGASKNIRNKSYTVYGYIQYTRN